MYYNVISYFFFLHFQEIKDFFFHFFFISFIITINVSGPVNICSVLFIPVFSPLHVFVCACGCLCVFMLQELRLTHIFLFIAAMLALMT